jgi:hypothetical protein
MSEINVLLLAKTVIVYTYPIISLIGFITNTLSFIIFSRKRFKNTIFFTYFRFLVIFDIITLVFPINKLFELNFNIYFRDFSDELCKFRFYFTYSIFPISGWVLVLISFDRFVNISFPNRFLLTKKATFQLSMCLIVFGLNFTYYIPNLFYYIRVNVNSKNSTNQTVLTYKCTNPGFPIEWMDIIESSLLPYLLMFSFTSFSIFLLFKSRSKSSIKSSNKSSIKKKDLRFALTSIALDFVFILLNLPDGILKLANLYNQNLFKNQDIYQFLSSLFYLIAYTNSALVFFINVTFNSMFRNELICFFKNKK